MVYEIRDSLYIGEIRAYTEAFLEKLYSITLKSKENTSPLAAAET